MTCWLQDFTGHRCWVSGWGKDQFGVAGSYQNVLKEVDVSVLDHDTCQARLQVGQMHCNFFSFLPVAKNPTWQPWTKQGS